MIPVTMLQWTPVDTATDPDTPAMFNAALDAEVMAWRGGTAT